MGIAVCERKGVGEGSCSHFHTHLRLPGNPELDGTALGVKGEAGGRGIRKALGL